MDFRKGVLEQVNELETSYIPLKRERALIRSINSNSNFYIHLQGIYSYLELIVGIRFDAVSKLVVDATRSIPMIALEGAAFKSKTMGLYREKIGDYCERVDHLGEFCPPASKISEPSEIIYLLDCYCDQALENGIQSLSVAVDYVWSKKLLDITSKYYFPASCAMINDWDRFRESVEYFRSMEIFRCGNEYDVFIDLLKIRMSN